MKRKFFTLVALAILAFSTYGCENTTSTPDPIVSPSPDPTPTPIADLCHVEAVTVNARVDGVPVYSWGLGSIAVLRADPKFAAEHLDPAFNTDACPELNAVDWTQVGDARCNWQGPLNSVEIRYDCDGAGQSTVCARPQGYDNVTGCSTFKIQGPS